jgi:hypothetical protein
MKCTLRIQAPPGMFSIPSTAAASSPPEPFICIKITRRTFASKSATQEYLLSITFFLGPSQISSQQLYFFFEDFQEKWEAIPLQDSSSSSSGVVLVAA